MRWCATLCCLLGVVRTPRCCVRVFGTTCLLAVCLRLLAVCLRLLAVRLLSIRLPEIFKAHGKSATSRNS